MTLREWLLANNRKSREIVELTGKSHQLVTGWLQGSRQPKLKDVLRIAEFTGGQVGLTDWIATDTQGRQRRRSNVAHGA